jgi:hypothetical protein
MESTLTTLEDYFARPETPAANSPTGKLMVAVLAKFPDLTFEAARAKETHCLTRLPVSESIGYLWCFRKLSNKPGVRR